MLFFRLKTHFRQPLTGSTAKTKRGPTMLTYMVEKNSLQWTIWDQKRSN